MKNIIVTGCAKGLGLEISRLLAKSGYNVIGVSRTATQEYDALINEYKDNVSFVQFDFVNTEDISSLVKSITKEYGRIFGLINNAALGHDGVLATMHESDISLLLKVNVEAPLLLTKYVSRSMLLNKEGRIINVGSIIGSTGYNGLSVYGATKSAMGGFTKSLARELGRAKITVNTLAPGYMETSMTGDLVGDKLDKIKRRSCLGRLANVHDASNAVLFLVSDAANGITGTTLTVDAGSTA
ncbi:SDR family NAD(P)-dependent oxidoreductase [Vibrio breoganii]|uniref:SDR family NAD(P)-dependent oxidoreductase n=1 Tax=Vibrio breoganii TaxID=553239 RepID=UPI0021C2D8D6|nr:SDR family oxidoreductase [Vibrio breoganii]MDN3715938.1 SDR family oxidoreductase [Vibrio breoganii]